MTGARKHRQLPAGALKEVASTDELPGDPIDEHDLTHAKPSETQPRAIDPAVVAWVQRSCLAQGIAVKITDTAVIEQICVLLTGTVRSAATKAQGRGTSSS